MFRCPCAGNLIGVYACGMKIGLIVGLCMALGISLNAASKQHVVTLGKWTSIKWQADNNNEPASLRIRPLYVDGNAREFTTGQVHDVTERTFVVQRMFRVNDSLPDQSGPPRWRWQKGGWMLVDRGSGKIQQLNAPEFDADRSAISWFRDYAAYCGTSADAGKTLVMVVQLGRRRPLLRKLIGDDHVCPAPVWQRDPVRVTFVTTQGPQADICRQQPYG